MGSTAWIVDAPHPQTLLAYGMNGLELRFRTRTCG